MNEITFDEWLAEFEKVSAENRPDQELYKKAVEFVVDHQSANTGLLAAGLDIGVTKARYLLAKMELDGIVTPVGRSTGEVGYYHRDVLLKKKEKK